MFVYTLTCSHSVSLLIGSSSCQSPWILTPFVPNAHVSELGYDIQCAYKFPPNRPFSQKKMQVKMISSKSSRMFITETMALLSPLFRMERFFSSSLSTLPRLTLYKLNLWKVKLLSPSWIQYIHSFWKSSFTTGLVS